MASFSTQRVVFSGANFAIARIMVDKEIHSFMHAWFGPRIVDITISKICLKYVLYSEDTVNL